MPIQTCFFCREQDADGVINSLGVPITPGQYVVIGNDANDYDIALVRNIVEDSTGNKAHITYYEMEDGPEMTLQVMHRPRTKKEWTDTCHINTIMLSLGHIKSLTPAIKQRITQKMKEIYNDGDVSSDEA